MGSHFCLRIFLPHFLSLSVSSVVDGTLQVSSLPGTVTQSLHVLVWVKAGCCPPSRSMDGTRTTSLGSLSVSWGGHPCARFPGRVKSLQCLDQCLLRQTGPQGSAHHRLDIPTQNFFWGARSEIWQEISDVQTKMIFGLFSCMLLCCLGFKLNIAPSPSHLSPKDFIEERCTLNRQTNPFSSQSPPAAYPRSCSLHKYSSLIYF